MNPYLTDPSTNKLILTDFLIQIDIKTFCSLRQFVSCMDLEIYY